MPLVDFTRDAMDGLKRDDAEIPVGLAKQQWETYEKGKLEAANVLFSKKQ